MRRYFKIGIGFLVIVPFIISCEKNIFGPNEGSLSGTITDNNGEVIEGAKITAAYTDGDETGSATTSSDDDGFYELNKVRLSENIITVEATGFETDERVVFLDQQSDEQSLSFDLNGAPYLSSFNLSSSIIDTTSGSTDSSATLTVNVRDDYNASSLTTYTVSAILYNQSDNSIAHIILLDASGNTSTLFVLEATFNSENVQLGSYSLTLEIEDPDGNSTTVKDIATLDVI
jgi:hypothetical protein